MLLWLLFIIIIIYIIFVVFLYLYIFTYRYLPNFKHVELGGSEKISTVTKDSKTLIADMYNIENTDTTVILCHGYRGKRQDMNIFVPFFKQLNIACLLPDARSHGESEGTWINFGFNGEDLRCWIKKLKHKKIILLGVSMGASTVLNAYPYEDDSRVKCIIVDSPFSSLKEELLFLLNHSYILNLGFLFFLNLLNVQHNNFNIYLNNPIDKNPNIPICILHGTRDEVIPVTQSINIFNKLKNNTKFINLYNGSHGSGIISDENNYKKLITNFLIYCKIITNGTKTI